MATIILAPWGKVKATVTGYKKGCLEMEVHRCYETKTVLAALFSHESSRKPRSGLSVIDRALNTLDWLVEKPEEYQLLNIQENINGYEWPVRAFIKKSVISESIEVDGAVFKRQILEER